MGNIRIGRVSSVNHEKGTVRVVYPDRKEDVTNDMPCLSFGGIYRMPKKEQMVLVLHLENGLGSGIVLGSFWNGTDMPADGGANKFSMEMTAGADIKAAAGDISINGSGITFNAGESITLEEIIQKLKQHEIRITALGG